MQRGKIFEVMLMEFRLALKVQDFYLNADKIVTFKTTFNFQVAFTAL